MQKVLRNQRWPGKLSRQGTGKWNGVIAELNALEVGGSAVCFRADDDAEVVNIRSVVGQVQATENAKENGWRFETTQREYDLYVRKAEFSAE